MQRVKNPKRVAAERTRLAREKEKKAAEAYLAENKANAATAAPRASPDYRRQKPQVQRRKK